jgi:hypothetical protein
MNTSSQQTAFHAGSGARSSVVNRTRRVVREQALAMREQKQRSRSLWVPVAICSALLLVSAYAAWALLDSYELNTNGVLDASYQMLIFLACSLPVTILVICLIWLKRSRSVANGDV